MTVLLLLTLATAQDPAPAVKLPAEAVAAPGRLVRLVAETTGKQVRWLLASDDADLIPFPDGKTAVFSAAKPGRYHVYAWTAAGDVPSEAARCVVVVGDAPPGPKPPDPPKPADPLRARLKAAYDADAAAMSAKERARGDLVLLYRTAAGLAADPAVATAGALAARIRAASKVLAGDLEGTRKVIAAELELAFPADGPLTDATRRQAADLFVRIATALDW